MESKMNMLELETSVVRLGDNDILVTAWIGDLDLGHRTYKNTTVKKALRMATTYIRINGSLH
jgi:hypothetical protein